MSANGQVVALSPGDQLRDRLDDPAIAASLNSLLDHADLLAILVTGLDGFVRRGDQISESLASAVGEIRGASLAVPGLEGVKAELGSVDVQALAATLASLASALVAAAPTLNKILNSPLVDPQAADVLADLGEALVEGKAAAAADPGGPKGLFGLWRVSKDKDINRGLGFLVQVARAFGRQLPK
ncbi:hypothetical protein A9W98_23730 [Mycobacterium gordonae]|jgi:hypothetical protein|uniref:DUF1641 domain-containing protein n=1 Tax=Mycobacterium gordonae TaxID=1778 RepID=A0A1A6BEG3_MYCGO|nr:MULTISPECIES: DUF1641 domain-containing protein [Mycobacterium]MBI2702607.1 DUF1641 domain-containing protein [Mycobacterium sp.]OBS00710.1 hypothetical protein A9W98_23730 [Mycobacterium gordonae]PJE17219.1 MAG: DUF1641 domain-containing protein [Mycobacterium sp.]